MLDPNIRYQLSDELLRRFGAVLRGTQLYSGDHPIVTRNLEALNDSLRILHANDAAVVIGLLGDELIVGDQPMAKTSSSMGESHSISRSGSRWRLIDQTTRSSRTTITPSSVTAAVATWRGSNSIGARISKMAPKATSALAGMI